MNVAWLDELLPQAVLSPRTKVLWVLFFALFPLAYVGGVMLQLAEESPARIPGAVDRSDSIRYAREFAASRGLAVAGWQEFATAETNKSLLAYYGEAKQPDLAAQPRWPLRAKFRFYFDRLIVITSAAFSSH